MFVASSAAKRAVVGSRSSAGEEYGEVSCMVKFSAPLNFVIWLVYIIDRAAKIFHSCEKFSRIFSCDTTFIIRDTVKVYRVFL